MLSTNKTYRAPPNTGEVILGQTLLSLLDEACDRFPNPRAFNHFTDTGWQPLSNHELRTAAAELALGLLDLELEKGDCIALLMHSDVEFCIADMGSLLAGLVNVPIDLTQTIEHIIFILQHTEAKALIISNLELLSQILPYLENTTHLKTVIVADVPDDWHQQHKIGMKVFSLDEILSQGRDRNSEVRIKELKAKIIADDLATIIYIPGITGEPQGVMLTHENLSANALAMFTGIPDLKFGSQEVILSFLPLTHVLARVFVYGHINYGHSIYFSNANKVLKHLKEVKPTIFATVPLLLEKVYAKLIEAGEKNPKQSKKVKENLPHQRVTILPFRFPTASEAKTALSNLREATLKLSTTGRNLKTHLLSSRNAISARQLYLPISQSMMKWAVKLAQKYELGKKLQHHDALMLKVADSFVFSQWRAVFGGNIKYLLSGGAALKPEIVNLFAAAGIKILQGYGLTETSSAVSCNRSQFNRAGTVGVPIAGVEVAIAEDGEILTKSPYNSQGYYKNSTATQQLIDAQGWLHTGDLGEFTPDGFLKITGLKKSRFKLSTGKYVTPLPIESKLEKSPLIAHAVTVGADCKFCSMLIFPDLENLHQQAIASGIDASTEELLQHPCIIALYQALVDEANCHLPHWSNVKRFHLINFNLTVENGMLTLTQEVNRVKILEVFAQEINAMYEEKRAARAGNVTIEQINDLCPANQTFSCPTFAQSLNS
ncbi:AMP-binding protein [Calothrix sp. FACHB-1219]|uniref:AMP-dependent synthetase/ligase n=1 Tax=unclassified Calothrix TaxID=2619626 RepID=UPI001685C44C|nr:MULTISPECIES: AMP-binding protein [unclassified Calothrix]MBD2206589.1 AMP-binding protein [Calothrix sp. FACHB-168]MBD2221384.1 AMP-binding protein [Calothrix sp. FACHB-1219]